MADIVIRGVDMPKGDLEYVSLWVYGDGRVYVSNQASATSSQRLQDLVILLPEGHGKLGDLDALEKELAFDYAYAAAKVCHDALTLIPAEEGNADDNLEELYAAVRLLSKHCRESACYECVLKTLCHNNGDCICNSAPQYWPDPEEGGGGE